MKYPRTPHLPWSPGVSKDDIILNKPKHLLSLPKVIYTEKLDGEITCMTSDYIHARSAEGYNKPWQSHMKAKWVSSLRYNIPKGLQLFGENLFGVHSIKYEFLPEFFFLFNIIKDNKFFLSWEEVKEISLLMTIPVVPIIKIGKLEELLIPTKSSFGSTCEGYVVRNILGFNIENFNLNVAKCVKANHITTDKYWTQNWKKAKLFKGEEK